MAALTFTRRADPAVRLDLGGLVPAALAGLAPAEIERLVLAAGRHPVRVGDVFAVSGDEAATIRILGGLERFDRVGAGLAGGAITVEGEVGAGCGAEMTDGDITVAGRAGPFLGAGMAGGRITVTGDAGANAGGALYGRTTGMRGGVLAIGGEAGPRAGDRMRRGLLVAAAFGPEAGARMIAGTLVGGSAAVGAGRLMKRGTLLLGDCPTGEAPTFVDCGAHDLPFLTLLHAWLARLDLPWRPEPTGTVRRWQGDTAVLGEGEILVAE